MYKIIVFTLVFLSKLYYKCAILGLICLQSKALALILNLGETLHCDYCLTLGIVTVLKFYLFIYLFMV